MRRRVSFLAMLVSLTIAACARGEPPASPYHVEPGAPFVLKGVKDVTNVARLTGSDSINKTDRYAVAGTDLGSMFNLDDKTYFAFGDTFGYRRPGMTAMASCACT